MKRSPFTTRLVVVAVTNEAREIVEDAVEMKPARVGLVAKTAAPVPVSLVRAAARLALDGVARKVATLLPRPEIPVETGRPVALVSVADVGVPRIGVTKVGEVAKTAAPVPVSLVRAVVRLALDGVARKVATPAASPETPVLIGRPVALVKVAADGVPRFGVTKVGEVAKTATPVPVSSVIAEVRFAEVRPPASRAATPPVYVKKPWSPLAISPAAMSVPSEAVSEVPERARPVPVRSVTRSDPSVSEVPVALMNERRVIVEVAVARIEAKLVVPVKVGAALKTTLPVPVSLVSDERSSAEVIDEAAVP